MVSKGEILDHASNGTLHRLILEKYERGTDADDMAIGNLASAMHNDGEIDLLAVPTEAALEEVKGFNFFTLQQFFCAVIPKLQADPLRLMEAVTALVDAGGEDMASNLPNAAYRDWCASAPERPDTVLQLVEAGNPQAKDYLSLTLEAGARSDAAKYITKAINFIRTAPEHRFGAMTALSRIDSSGQPKLAHEALATVTGLLDNQTNDMMQAHVLVMAVAMYARAPQDLHDIALGLVSKAVVQRGDGVLHQSASMLFNHHKVMSDTMIERLLDALEDVKPANGGTINTLDVALSALATSGKGARVSAFLESVFQSHPDMLSFKQFDSLGHTLMTKERALYEDMAVRWLLSGERSLASHIADLLGGTSRTPTLFEVDVVPYSLSDEEALFLARKAVGWFFFHPITAASLLICILRSVKGDVANDIGDLLFEPLLLNFSGELRKHLKGRIKGAKDKAKPQIRRAVDMLDAYLDDLRAVGFIAELEPSERERLIERQQQSEQMRQIQKQAEQSSVLLSVISKSIILHGNGSVGYRRDTDGTLHRHAMKMGGFSTSWEAPRFQAIDPFGLDMQLRQFRAERLAS